MADQMDLAPGLSQRFVDGLVQAALDQQVRAFRIDCRCQKNKAGTQCGGARREAP